MNSISNFINNIFTTRANRKAQLNAARIRREVENTLQVREWAGHLYICYESDPILPITDQATPQYIADTLTNMRATLTTYLNQQPSK